MSEMSDEALAELLAKAEAATHGERHALFFLECHPATVAALIREVQQHRAQAREERDAALEEVAQDFEMLTAGGRISGLEAADAVRRRKSKRND